MPKAPSTIEITETSTETGEDLDRPWLVTVYNDPVNLMGYVTMILMRIFGYPREKAERMMLDIHRKGRCIVWSGERERAELYVEQLHQAQLKAGLSQSD